MSFHAAMDNFAESWMSSRESHVQDVNESGSSGASVQSDGGSPSIRAPLLSPTNTSIAGDSFNQPDGDSISTAGIGARMLPIHCVVRRSDSMIGAVVLSESRTLLRDAFAILPAKMLFQDIIRGALVKMGFPSEEAIGAKGFIQLRNWKPLVFTAICDSPNRTIEDILSDVTSTATLIICLSRVSLDDVVWTDEAVRSAVFMLLKEVSQTALSKMSPLPQSMISNIVNSKYAAKISASTCAEFGVWYRCYRRDHEEPHIASSMSSGSRQTFHSSYELPLMRSWYAECSNPSDEQLNTYLAELNSSPMRQERGAISLARLRMWWKNEKQRNDRRLSMGETLGDGSLGALPRERRRRRKKSSVAAVGTGINGADDNISGIPEDASMRQGRGEERCIGEVGSGEMGSPPPGGGVDPHVAATAAASWGSPPPQRRRRRRRKAEMAGYTADSEAGAPQRWAHEQKYTPAAQDFSGRLGGVAGGGGNRGVAPPLSQGFDIRATLSQGFDLRNGVFNIRPDEFNNICNNSQNILGAAADLNRLAGAPQRCGSTGNINMSNQLMGGSGGGLSGQRGVGADNGARETMYNCPPGLNSFNLAAAVAASSGVGAMMYPRSLSSNCHPASDSASHRQSSPLSLIRSSWN